MSYTTRILSQEMNDILTAADLLKQGEVVGIPTETVYGLAADATDENAVAKIFKAKGRPSDNPLIVHIADVNDFERYVKDIPELAYKLAEEFWPGPLTMVLPKLGIIPYVTSGGLETVGIRIPCHNTAREIIRECGKPLAAPSANLSGSPSPTSAEHVLSDMNGRIPAVVDGGACHVGVESTVISFENNGIRLLRPGFITVEDLRALGITVYCDKGITEEILGGEKVLSPGMKYKHYSPKANITLVSGEIYKFIRYMSDKNKENTYAMIFNKDKRLYPYENYFSYGDTPEEQAAELFGILRKIDDVGAKKVYARCPSADGVGLAVYNRLLRAAGFEVVNL